MKSYAIAGLGIFLSLAVGSAAFQVSDVIKSGPQAGDFLPGAFHFLNLNGAHGGKPHCLVCEYGLRPTVAVFLREPPEAGKPLMGLLQKLDAAVVRYHDGRFRSFVVFLNDDYTKKEVVGSLEKFVQDANLKNLVVCVGPAAGPEKYNINKDADVTVVIYDKLKVVENYTFAKDKVTDRYVNAILATVDRLAGARK